MTLTLDISTKLHLLFRIFCSLHVTSHEYYSNITVIYKAHKVSSLCIITFVYCEIV